MQAAVFVEIPLAGRLHHHADDAGIVEVEVEQRLAGLGLHFGADFDQAVPGDVLEVGSGEAGLLEEVRTVEEAGDARIEGHRVGLAVMGGSRHLVLGEDRHIDVIGQRLKCAGE
ncbi:hypothetical protein D3C87_1904260 [compost metagenome]